ncbi:MAG: translocation/assembly module TamB domain-containing protein, partial [Bacteroidota bacterium]
MEKIHIKIFNSKAFDIIRTVIVIIFSFLILLTVVLQIPWVQNRIAQVVISKIKEDKGINASLDKVSIVLPNAVRLKTIYLGDEQNDTIFSADQFSVRISLFPLIWKKANVRWVELEGVKAYLKRPPNDSTFNFSYIPAAFQSEKPKDTTTTEKEPFYFFLRQLQLTDIHFVFTDSLNQTYFKLDLNDFNLKNDSLSIQDSKIVVQDISMDGVDFSFTSRDENPSQVNEAPSTSNNEKSPLEIGLNDEIDLKDVQVSLNIPGLDMFLNANKLSLKSNDFSFQNQLVDVHSINLDDFSVDMNQYIDDANAQESAHQSESKPWNISVSDLQVKAGEFNLSLPDTGDPVKTSRPFYMEPKLASISLQASDVLYNKNTVAAVLEDLSFYDLSGFRLTQLTTNFEFSNTDLMLKNTEFVTPASKLSISTSASYPHKDYIKENLYRIPLDINIEPSVIAISDLKKLVPGFDEFYLGRDTALRTVRLESTASGSIDSLHLKKLRIGVDNLTTASLKGTIAGLPATENLWFDLSLDSLRSEKKHYVAFMPDTAIPTGLSLPSQINLTAMLNGALSDFKTNVKLETSYGDLLLQGNITRGGSEQIRYDGELTTEQLHVGAFLKNPDTIGRLNLSQSLVFALDTVTGPYVNTTISKGSMEALGYTYQPFTIDALFEDDELKANLAVNDTNFKMTFDGTIKLSDTLPSVHSTLNLKGINLQAVNITKEDIRVGSFIETDITGINPSDMNGYARITDLVIVRNGKTHSTDSIRFSIDNRPNHVHAELNSELLSASYKGTAGLEEVPEILKNSIAQHLSDSARHSISHKDKKFEFRLTIPSTPLIREVLLPGIEKMEPITMKASYSPENSVLSSDIRVPYVNYNENIVDSFEIHLNLDKDSAFVTMGLQKAVAPPFSLSTLSIRGDIIDKEGRVELVSFDLEQAEKYVINSIIRFIKKDSVAIRFDNHKMVLNYKEFQLPADHAILLSTGGVEFRDFVLQSGNQNLSVKNHYLETTGSDGFNVSFGNFQIENLFSLVQQQKGWVRGIIDGRLLLTTVNDIPVFESDINITNIQLMQRHAFDSIGIQADNLRENTITIDGGFFNENSAFVLNGEMYDLQTDQPKMVLNTNFDNFDLAHIEPLLEDQFREIEAILNGAVELRGPLSTPDFNGSITFREANITLADFRSTFVFNDQTIQFNDRNIRFDQFTFSDARNNQAQINGVVGFKDYSNPTTDLKIKATSFDLFNIPRSADQDFYGKVVADFDGSVKGSLRSPSVDLQTSFKEETDFTYIVPQTVKATVNEQGIVEFIQEEKDTLNPILSVSDRDTMLSDQALDLSLKVNISTDPEASFSVITNPVTNEKLTIQGKGNLGFNMTPVTTPSLSGQYEISEGSYTLILYDVIRKEFNIREGS